MAMENVPFEERCIPYWKWDFPASYVRLPECNTHKHNGKILITWKPWNSMAASPVNCLLGQLPPEDLGLLVFFGPPAIIPKRASFRGDEIQWVSQNVPMVWKSLIYINTLFLYLKIMPKPYKHSVICIWMFSHPLTGENENEGFMVQGSPTKNLIILLVTDILAGYPNV